jgi:drug/metabolite transporter (DMT)-like permease
MSLAARAPIVRATLWMFGAIVSFSTMAIAGRELSAELTTFQILFFRSLAGFVLMVVLLSRTGWWQLKTQYFGIHVIRNLAHYGGQYGWFDGIALIPLAEVFAIEFTMPIWTAIFAVLLLGERISRQRKIAIAIGFAGVLVMLRPGIAVVSPAALAVLAAALAYGFAHALTKKLSGTDSPMAILFYTTAIQLPLALIPALRDWAWPSLAMWPWVIGVGTAALAAHYCLTRAFMLEDAAVVMPIDFLRLPFIAVIGFVFYDEPIELWVFIGAAIVFFGSWLNLRAGPGGRAAWSTTSVNKPA